MLKWLFIIVILLGHGALYRAKAAYSHRPFPPSIGWSVRCTVAKMVHRIWMQFGTVG